MSEGHDSYLRQAAAQVALGAQAEHCEMRSNGWLRKLLDQERLRIAKHAKEVRPSLSENDSQKIANGLIFGAFYGARGDLGSPEPDPTDIMKSGEGMLAKSMACQVIEYRKSDILVLDAIADPDGS